MDIPKRSLTKLDLEIFNSVLTKNALSTYVALNPIRLPGSLVVGYTGANTSGLTAQVACKLALERYLEGVLDFFAASNDFDDINIPIQTIEAAFKGANRSVFDFAHKMTVGGKMSASMIGFVIHNGTIAAARVGNGYCYLFRNNVLDPFFIRSEQGENDISKLGVTKSVSVEIATIDLAPHDSIILSTEELTYHDVLKRNFKSFVMQCNVGPSALYLSK